MLIDRLIARAAALRAQAADLSAQADDMSAAAVALTPAPQPPAQPPVEPPAPPPAGALPYRLPEPGEIVLIGGNTTDDIRPAGFSAEQWGYSLFDCFGGGTFVPRYSQHGAYVIAGSGGHMVPENTGAVVFDFSTALFSRIDNAQGVPSRVDPFRAEELNGPPYYEIGDSGVPAPGHPYATLVPSPLGDKGSVLCLTRSAVGGPSFGSPACHALDLATRRWSAVAGPMPHHSPEHDALWDEKRNCWWYVPYELHYHQTMNYLDGADMRWKETAPADTFYAGGASGNGLAIHFNRVMLVNGMLVRNVGPELGLWVFDPDNPRLGWVRNTNIVGALPVLKGNRWAPHGDGCWYHIESLPSNSLVRIRPPANPQLGAWTFDSVTLSGPALPTTSGVTDPGATGHHYTRFFYVPALDCLAWMPGRGKQVSLLKPPAIAQIPPPPPQPPLPPPPPPAPPPPPPPPVEGLPVVHQQLLSGPVIAFRAYKWERSQNLEVWRDANVVVQAFGNHDNYDRRPLEGGVYRLFINDVEVSSATYPTGFMDDMRFPISTAALTPGWQKLGIKTPGTEVCLTYFAYLLRPGAAAPDTMPVVKAAGVRIGFQPHIHQWAMVPTTYAPTAVPLTPRAAVPFDYAMNGEFMNARQIIVTRRGDSYRPNWNKDGIESTFNQQTYFWHTLIRQTPRGNPVIDGPRGIGTLSMITHIEPGHGPRGNDYVCTPWGIHRIAADGHITTLAGLRNRDGRNIHYADDNPLSAWELVGDWSRVRPEWRHFSNLWGWCFDHRTTTVDESLPMIEGEHPHGQMLRSFSAVPEHGAIFLIEFRGSSAEDRNRKGVVSEFITGLVDPFQTICDEGILYTSERGKNRVVAHDATTGQFLRVVVEGPSGLAYIDNDKFFQRTPSSGGPNGDGMNELRAVPCVLPEGLFKLPGDPWLYVASSAQSQVRRIHLTTGANEVACNEHINNGWSSACKVTVSDGSFGPRGTVFVSNFANLHLGMPATFLPEGMIWPNGGNRFWGWMGGLRRYGPWSQFIYNTCCAVFRGRLLIGGTEEALVELTQAQAGDPENTAAVARGALEFHERGLDLSHGHQGYGFHGLPLPWGVSADMDAAFRFWGHAT